MKMRKLLAVLLIFVLVASLFAGCGAAMANDSYYEGAIAPESANGVLADSAPSYNRAPNKENAAEDTKTEPADDTSVDTQNQKLIRTVYMDAETEDMDALLYQVEERIQELGGYVEGREIYNGSMYNSKRYRSASLTVRVPAGKLSEFVDHVGQVSNITSNRETVEDVTLKYVAIESRIKALETEEATLLELMAKAENMSDLLTIEARLTDVRYELETIHSQLRVYDNKVNYATIHLDIDEVVEYTEPEPENGWQRMGKGFVKSLKGLWTGLKEVAIFLVAALPYLALIAAIPVVIILIVRTSIRRKRKKAAQQKPEE